MTGLSQNEIRILRKALKDTRTALANYNQVISDFGPMRPFPTLSEVETCHIKALEALFVRYGLTLPRARRRRNVPHFPDLAQAFATCIAAETKKVRLYEHLHAEASQQDILAEMLNLMRASRDGHLPALHDCAKRAHVEVKPGNASLHEVV